MGKQEGGKLQGQKMGKGNSSKVNDTKGFLTLRHSNWTICNLFSSFCSKIFPLFTQPPIINNFFFMGRKKREAAGPENGKRELFKSG